MQKSPQKQNLLNHRVRKDVVLIVPIYFDNSSSDVVVESADYEDKPEWGYVISAGELVTDLQRGDVVLYMAYGGTKVQSLGQDFYYIREEDVVSVHVPEASTTL